MAFCIYPFADLGSVIRFTALVKPDLLPEQPSMFLTLRVIGDGPTPELFLQWGNFTVRPKFQGEETAITDSGLTVFVAYEELQARSEHPGRTLQVRFRFTDATGANVARIFDRTTWEMVATGTSQQSLALLVADNESDAQRDLAVPVMCARTAYLNDRDVLSELRSIIAQSAHHPPIGSISAFAGIVSPSWEEEQGWLLCDGRSLLRSDPKFELLSRAIDRAWGGDDDRFCLPDLRGRFLRGVDLGSGNDPDAASRESASVGGNRGDIVGSNQEYATARPSSTPFVTSYIGGHVHRDPTGGGPSTGGLYTISAPSLEGANYSQTASTGGGGEHEHTILGGGDPETRPRNAAVHFVIRYR